MNRLAAALIAYVVLGVLTWTTISDSRVRAVTLAILALFAMKSWLRRKDVLHADGEDDANASAAELRRSFGANDAPQDDQKDDKRVEVGAAGPM
jgi:hypothetical protein